MACCTLPWHRDRNEHQASAITNAPTASDAATSTTLRTRKGVGYQCERLKAVTYCKSRLLLYAYRLQLKITVPWDVTPGRLIFTDGSEEFTVSIFRVVQEECF